MRCCRHSHNSGHIDRRRLAFLTAGLLVLPASSAQAHGITPEFAAFAFSFLGLYVASHIITDYFVFKRGLVPARSAAASMLANLAMAVTVIAGVPAWEWSASTLADQLDGMAYGGLTYGGYLRMYGWWVGVPMLVLAGIVAEAMVLKWCFAVPLSRRLIKMLGLTSIVCVLFAGAVAMVYARQFI
jgi:hypothetical protein